MINNPEGENGSGGMCDDTLFRRRCAASFIKKNRMPQNQSR